MQQHQHHSGGRRRGRGGYLIGIDQPCVTWDGSQWVTTYPCDNILFRADGLTPNRVGKTQSPSGGTNPDTIHHGSGNKCRWVRDPRDGVYRLNCSGNVNADGSSSVVHQIPVNNIGRNIAIAIAIAAATWAIIELVKEFKK